MAFVNMFNDRVEQFNLREENERLAELFSDEKLQEEAQWQAYSVKEISRFEYLWRKSMYYFGFL